MHELARTVDTTDEWIVQRTGIHERHIAAEGELTSDLAHPGGAGGARQRQVDAAVDRSDRARRPRRPTTRFPATAVSVQAGLGITRGAASTCRRSAPASSLRSRHSTACCAAGSYKRALVIGAETFSRILDWNDRTTCVLFGDGAGAVVLEAQEQPGTRE